MKFKDDYEKILAVAHESAAQKHDLERAAQALRMEDMYGVLDDELRDVHARMEAKIDELDERDHPLTPLQVGDIPVEARTKRYGVAITLTVNADTVEEALAAMVNSPLAVSVYDLNKRECVKNETMHWKDVTNGVH